MKKLLILSLSVAALFASCGQKQARQGIDPDKPVYVTMKTSMGDVTFILYDDTPLHRENMIKLCREGFYDSIMFHRIVENFVVQGGDPANRMQDSGKRHDEADDYVIPAEILPHYFNRRGVLLDAKRSDDVNPERVSAGTQFCFMQGKVMTDMELDEAEVRINNIRRNWLYHLFKKRLTTTDPTRAEEAGAAALETEVNAMVADTLETLGIYAIPEARREVYRTAGGAPHLDGSVTIFGEVVEGLDVVERMSLVETEGPDHFNRPLKPVWIISTTVFQK